jgi:hypothetical protein
MPTALYEFMPAAYPSSTNRIGIPIPNDPGSTVAGGAGAAASLAYTPDPDKFVEIAQIDCSYSGAPTGGALTITEGATTIFQLDLGAAGPYSISWRQPKVAKTKGATVTVTLAAPGGAIVGKLNVQAYQRA